MKKWILFLAVGLVAYFIMNPEPVVLGPGVSAPEVPLQTKLSNATQIKLDEYTLSPVAEFSLQAKVLAKKQYRSGREADLSPFDLALGWGRMSDEQILESINFSQSNRWYRWKTPQLPIPRKEIETFSANMHMIPANDFIKDSLAQVKEGQVISLQGYLVNVVASDGWKWRSSLTRNDTGGGACEVIFVEHFSIL